jgi:O-6-methylguanine DNA methyltransferase
MTAVTGNRTDEIERAIREELGRAFVVREAEERRAAARLGRRVIRLARRHRAHLDRIREEFVIDASARGVTAIRPGRSPETPGAMARRLAEQAREELLQYLDGERSYFTVPVDLTHLPRFQHQVLDEARRIPFGEVRSYSYLAGRIDHPRAARAVGTALGRNPVPFIVPCHRVLREDESLGGYAFGLPLKSDLLDLERATPVLQGCTSTRILCRVGCPALRRARPDRRVAFASVRDARSVGYRPCRVCRPDGR